VRYRVAMLVLRLAALIGLGVSAAMHVDYARPVSALCETGSGCDKVRASQFSHLLGIPVPVIGIAAFSLLLALSLVRNQKARLVTVIGAIGGLAAAVVFLTIQAFSIRAFCKLCVVVDASAIVAGAAAVIGRRAAAEIRTEPVWPWVGATVLWAVLPLAWARTLPPPPVPRQISELWRPNKINVVEFADFECPYCRQLHPLLSDVLEAYAGKAHLTRLNMPLGLHPHARDAARAYCCADDAGKGDRMADALFSASDLGPDGCEQIAVSLEISLPAFRACVASAATQRRIESEINRFTGAKLRGLPAVFVGDTLLIGMQSIDTLRDVFARSDRRAKPHEALPWLLSVLGVIAALLALALPAFAFWQTTDETRGPVVG
jgi:uncharacterized membrane protein/predicted DsbA family dithiol-disulfide isomerase